MEQVFTENRGAAASADRGIPDRTPVVELFVLLNTARKLGEFCSADHPRCLEAVEQAAKIFRGLGEYTGELSFASNDGSISAGGSRLKPEEPYLDNFAAALRTAEITVVRLGDGVNAASLTSFISLLAASTDIDVGTGQVRQLISGLVAVGVRVGMSPATGQAADLRAVSEGVEEAVWKAEVRRLLGAGTVDAHPPDSSADTQVVLSAINPRRLAGLINEFDSVASPDNVYENFLVPYLRQAADNGSESEGLVPDHVGLGFAQLLRALSPGHQVRFIKAVFETSHTFTRFAENILEAVPIHLAGKALASIRTEENTIHPRITNRFEALCRLTGWVDSPDDTPPMVTGKVDIDVESSNGVVRCTPRFEKGPATAPAQPARRISFAAEFSQTSKRKALTRVCLDLLERSTTPEEARAHSRTLPPLLTEALAERDWAGLTRDWVELTSLVNSGRSAKPFLAKTLQRIRESFITTQAMERMVSGIENGNENTRAVFKQLLPALGPASGESLILALVASNNRTQRRNLLSVIVSYGLAAVPMALKRISDHRWYVVRNMIAIIREVGDKRAVEKLVDLSDHPQYQVRRELISTFITMGHPAGLELAEKSIRSGDRKLRSASIGLLGSNRVAGAHNILLQVLEDQVNDGEPFTQPQKVSAVWALGQIGDGSVLPSLQKLLKKNRMFKSPESHELKMAILRSLPEYPIEATEPLARWGVSRGDDDETALCSKLLSDILLFKEKDK
jgi:hypothetical protein